MFLDCRKVSFQYPETDKPVFDKISLTITEPGFHALFGPSGVGKTSFAKIVSGQLKGYGGTVDVGEGRVLYTYNLERLPGWSSVGKHLDKVTPPHRIDLKDQLIHTFGVAKFLGMRFSQMSLGQQNRINLLRYLLQDFDLLIMDESLANVDEPTREKIILKIKDLFAESAFIYISHNVIEVATFCNQILIFTGAQRTPPSDLVKGCDKMTGSTPQKNALEKTMLEIMNAA